MVRYTRSYAIRPVVFIILILSTKCFIGASSTGKTSIVIRYTQNKFFEDEDDPTLGLCPSINCVLTRSVEDSHKKDTTIDSIPCLIDILDTGGEAPKHLHEKVPASSLLLVFTFRYWPVVQMGGCGSFCVQVSREDRSPSLI